MTITYGVDRIAASWAEMDDLIDDYYERTEAHEGVPKLDFDWSFYRRLEMNDSTLTVSAREAKKLVGFNMYIVMPHPQYRPTIVAHCNTLAVNPDYRGQGIATKLVQMAELLLSKRDVDLILHGHRSVYKKEPLFPKLGYEPMETIYCKRRV